MAAWLILVLLFYVISAIFLPPAITAHALSFDYPGFKLGDVKLYGEAYVEDSEIKIGVHSVNREFQGYRAARITSFQWLQLWDDTTGKNTSFTTRFSFKMYKKHYSQPGDGMAFFLADPNLPVLKEIKESGGLGLVDSNQVFNSTQHSFMAVEFDTYKNSWDPNYAHMGMNVNSMKSSKLAGWSYNWRGYHDCIIRYKSATLHLSVFCTHRDNHDVSTTQHISHNVGLRNCLPEWVIVGFSAATADALQNLTLRSWSFRSSFDHGRNTPTITPDTTTSPNLTRKYLEVGLCVAVSSLGLIYILLRKCQKTGGKEQLLTIKKEGNEEESICDPKMDEEFQRCSGPKKFCHDELVTATNNFSEENKIGHGGSGGVYKGFLKDLNTHVAIKKIFRESKQGIKEYTTEVKIISQLRHRNLVQLIGWCHKKKNFLLIYEYMPNGSLDSHLYHGKSFLTWQVRYDITLDLASALLYLHEEREQCVLHRDIKTSNIMLCSGLNAKLGDFGLARLVDHEKGSQTTVIAGTRGYIAPEYFTRGKASKESDIYSFGVVVLEIASGRKPIDLNDENETTVVEWAWELYGMGKFIEVADRKLCGAFDKQQMQQLVVLGIWCAHPDSSSRPSIRQVIQVLNFEAPLPNLPKKMPVLTYQPPTI